MEIDKQFFNNHEVICIRKDDKQLVLTEQEAMKLFIKLREIL